MNEQAYWFNYLIELEDGQQTRFDIQLDPETLTMLPTSPEPYPPWTQNPPLGPMAPPYAQLVAEMLAWSKISPVSPSNLNTVACPPMPPIGQVPINT